MTRIIFGIGIIFIPLVIIDWFTKNTFFGLNFTQLAMVSVAAWGITYVMQKAFNKVYRRRIVTTVILHLLIIASVWFISVYLGLPSSAMLAYVIGHVIGSIVAFWYSDADIKLRKKAA